MRVIANGQRRAVSLWSLLMSAFWLLTASAAGAAELPGAGRVMVTDRIVLKPNPATGSGAVRQKMQTLGVRVKAAPAGIESKENALAGLGLMVVDVDPSQHSAVINELAARSDVRLAAPVYRYEPAVTPNDASYSSQYHLPLVGLPAAWDTTQGSSSIIIAILDTGVDTHADLAANLMPGFNFFDNNTNTADVRGHGTATAGVAAAIGNNGVGVAGTAWKSRILPCRIADNTGAAYSDTIAAAIKWAADQGARVINCSYGPLQGDLVIENAAQYARNKGALVFVSSGNDGNRDGSPMSGSISFVGATNSSDTLVSWSTTGPAVKLVAPGERLLTTARGGGYANFSGTSFSCPLVAGIAALCWSGNPNLSATALENILHSTAVDRGPAGWDERYGYGRIDAKAAMAAVLESRGIPAAMQSPAPDSTLPNTSPTFTWSTGKNVSRYWLSVGTSAGGKELFDRETGTLTTMRVDGLPLDGRPLFVRLWSQTTMGWEFRDYRYNAGSAATTTLSVLLSPSPDSALSSQATTFNLSAGSSVTGRWLELGSTLGATDVLSKDLGTSLSFTFDKLPADGRALFVRVWSQQAGKWLFNDFRLTAAPRPSGTLAALTSPAQGAMLGSATQTFTWTSGSNVSAYWIEIGTAPGDRSLANRSLSTTSFTATNLPVNGSTVFVRLWSRLGDQWQNFYTDYTFTAANLAGVATIASPLSGSTLDGPTTTFQWTPASGASEYWLEVGTTKGGSDLFGGSTGSSTSRSVTSLPADGRNVFVRLWSKIGGVWTGHFTDVVYKASAGGASALASLTSPVAGSTLAGSSVTFAWSAASGATEYWLEIGSSAGGHEYFNQSTGTSVSVTVNSLPTNGGTVFVRLWSKVGGTWNNNYQDQSFRAAGP